MKKLLILGVLALALAGCAGREYPCGTGTMEDEYVATASGPTQSGSFHRKTTINCVTEKTRVSP